MAFIENNEIKQNSSFSFKGGFGITFKSDISENRSGFRLWYRLANRPLTTTTISTADTTIPTTMTTFGINQTREHVSGCFYGETHFEVGTLVEPLCPKVSPYSVM